MPIVLYDKTNSKYVNDFQSRATSGGLMGNATKHGRNSNEFEVRTVSDGEFAAIEAEVNEPEREKRNEAHKIKVNKKNASRKSAKDKLKALGLTKDEIKVFV